ncbi:MAG: class I SAM-dependent methyltransferase [Clostridiales bacterium]|nr:class I SAM-dependent methyltransferase [Clostridiales bacterium]
MRVSDGWKDYILLDCSDGDRLESWGGYTMVRPDPQVIWNTPKKNGLWRRADAVYLRSKTGGGHWEFNNKLPDSWQIKYKDLTFNVKNMGFKHMGIFPEQAVNWDYVRNVIENSNRQVKVLNLFAYTGAATVSALKAGASVVHVDASKGMVQWAKENSVSSSVADKPVRWIVDDCVKFVQREIRRGNKYDIIIMDPPSYGRGPNGEVWKVENEVYPLVELCSQVLSEDPLVFLINSYTTGLSPAVMEYILGSVIKKKFGGNVSSDEIGLRCSDSGLVLPCGSSAIWEK